MSIETIIAYKPLALALTGAAYKTLHDYKKKKCSFAVMLFALTSNSALAIAIVIMLSDVIESKYPTLDFLVSPLSFVAGVAGVNLTLAIMSLSKSLSEVDWGVQLKKLFDKLLGTEK